MKTNRVASCPCPHCKRIVDSASDLDGGKAPKLGDVTVCISCAGVSQFGVGLVLEVIPEPKLSEVLAEPDIIMMQAAVRRLGPRPIKARP
jgi:hypothetical protein